ncbi:MAG: hypothetical protein ABJL54_08405 [Halioglobus sp.]
MININKNGPPHDVRDWWPKKTGLHNRRCLLLGKGPSFRQALTLNFDHFFTIGLNHVAREPLPLPLDIIHIFDLDVLESYDNRLLDNASYLLLPDTLNICYQLPFLRGNFYRSDKITVKERIKEFPLLRAFAAEGRLLTYPRCEESHSSGSWPVHTGSFSASTVMDLLSKLGISDILLAGIDGGTQYADSFQDLNQLTRLNGGQPNFNSQFAEFADIRNNYGISINHISMEKPRVYIGAMNEQRLAFEVLKHSIERHSSCDVEVLHLGDEIDQHFPEYQKIIEGLPAGTPFSLQRYAIPYLCKNLGRAIYVDSDMQVFSDIRELWQFPVGKSGFSAAKVEPEWGRPPQLSVMVIDCAYVDWDLVDIANQLRSQSSYEEFKIHGPNNANVCREIPSNWNSLEHFKDGETALIHFTSMPNQPWLSSLNPLAPIWCKALIDALQDGAVSQDDIDYEITVGNVRPSLAWQTEHCTADPLMVPADVLYQDRSFLPPHNIASASSVIRKAIGAGQVRPSKAQLKIRICMAHFRFWLNNGRLKSLRNLLKTSFFKARRALSSGFRAGW